MAKTHKLTDIEITHISLVKAGANGKEFIYKSAQESGGYENTIAIKKTDEEQGIVYGIVYAPQEVDSQGDFAEAEDIKKAAYGFMKSLSARNVDVQHSFESEAAFVAESWIVKAGDPIFGEEPEGSWAVAIQLESEELKSLAKSGALAGLSMAGKAHKTEVEKAQGAEAFKRFFESLADAAGEVWVDFGMLIKKQKGEELSQEIGNIIKEKLRAATQKAADDLEASLKDKEETAAKVAQIEKDAGELATQLTALVEENTVLKAENKRLGKEVETLSTEVEALRGEAREVEKQLKASAQTTTVETVAPKTKNKGVM